MQTKQQIQRLLASAGLFPNRRLGQNFLIDLNLMRLLVDSANIHSNDVVLEVGCGTGSLTEAIAEKAGRVVAVEFDQKLAEIVKSRLSSVENVEVVGTDVLESKNTISTVVIEAIESARVKAGGRLLVVANLPYSVGSAVMVNLTTGHVVADSMYVTVQKEVAERMTASPGNKHYGTLSIFLGATGEVKIMKILKPSVFWPAPQVDSAMVSFVRQKDKADRIHNIKLFGEVIAVFMQHRRKMLKACTKFAENRLKDIHNWGVIFEDCGVDPHKRPEVLSPEDFISITNLCYEYLGPG